MAKSSFVGAELQTSTNTFGAWLNQTNAIIYEMYTSVVTTSLDAAGDLTIGNSYVQGTFGADNFVAYTKLRGGTLTGSGTLSIGSSTTIDSTDVINSTAVTFTVNGSSIFNGVSTFNNDATITGTGALLNVTSNVPTATISAVTTLINGTNLNESVAAYTLAAVNSATITGARFDIDTAIFDVTSASTFSNNVTVSGVGKTTILSQDTNVISGATTSISSSTSTSLSSPVLIASNATSQTFTSALFDVTAGQVVLTSSETIPFDVFKTMKINGTTTDVFLKASRTLSLNSTTWNSSFINSTISGTGFLHLTAPTLNLNSGNLTAQGTLFGISSATVNFTGSNLNISNTTGITGNATLSGTTNAVSGTNFNISSGTTTFSGTAISGNSGATVNLQGTTTLGSAGKTVTIAGTAAFINSTATSVAGTLSVAGNSSFNGNVTVAAEKKLTLSSSSLTTSIFDFIDIFSNTYSWTFPTSSLLQLGSNSASATTFRLKNSGAGKFGFDIDGNQAIGGTLTVTGTSNFTGFITGTIRDANKWTTPRKLTINGDAVNALTFDGSVDMSMIVNPTHHFHSGTDINSGKINIAYLPVGPAHTQVAFGDHTHSGNIPTTGGTLTGDLNFANLKGIRLINNLGATVSALYSSADTNINVGSSSNPLLAHGSSFKFNDGLTTSTVIHTGNYAGLVDHNNLLNFSVNRHIDHSAVSVIAGNGLSGGGNLTASRALAIGAGAGIIVGISSIAISFSGSGVATSASRSDHIHSALAITSGTLPTSRLPMAGSGTAATLSHSDHNHNGVYDLYSNWKMAASGTLGTSNIASGSTFTLTAGNFVTATRVGSNVTIGHSDTSAAASLTALTGAAVISGLNFDGAGHVTSTSIRNLTVANIGAAAAGHLHTGVYARVTGADTFTGQVTITPLSGLGLQVNAPGTSIQATGDIISFFSDKRLKSDIEVIPDALDKISRLNGVIYNHNELSVKLGVVNEADRMKKHTGLIAQEVESVLPEAVTLAPFDNATGTSISGQAYKTIKYDRLVGLLVEGIKELQDRNQKLESRLEALEYITYE